MNIVIFEHSNHDNFYPLSLTKALWELRCGMFSYKERIELFIKEKINDSSSVSFFTRDYLAPLCREKYPDITINDPAALQKAGEFLFINATVDPFELYNAVPEYRVIFSDDIPLIGRVAMDHLDTGAASISEMLCSAVSNGVEKVLCSDVLVGYQPVHYIWDIVGANSRQIRSDFALIDRKESSDTTKSVTLVGDEGQLYIEGDVRIDPYVVFDTTEGPIVVKRGTVIHPFTRIEGPCCIGEESVILGAKIREGCSFGKCSRIGGEVEESIFHGYSNKYHDGFIGHAYVGEWVNLGAMTTNSDLKNNYENVRVFIPNKRIDTGMNKVGSFIGDFCKTSIGTLLNTGTSLGTGAMIVPGADFPPTHVPPFSWYIDSSVKDLMLMEDFIDTCRIMTSRRGVEFSQVYSDCLKYIYDETASLRKRESLKWSKQRK